MMPEQNACPADWRIEALSNKSFIQLGSGGTPSRENNEYFEGDIPWVKSGELRDNYIYDTEEHITKEAVKNSSAKLYEENTLLMAMYGATVGKTAILKVPAATNQAICSFRPVKDSFIAEYLRYQLIHIRPRLLRERHGGAQPNISQTIIKTIELPFPPLPEQRSIAAVLAKIQEAIAAQQEIIDRTRELKKALMAKLFTEGLRGESTKETEIGPVPKSWSVVTIGTVCQVPLMNGAFVKRPTYGEGIKFLNVEDTYAKSIVDLASLPEMDISPDSVSKYCLQSNDILFVRSSLKRAGIAQCCMVIDVKEPVFFDCHLIKLTPNISVVYPEYLVGYWLSPRGHAELESRSKTTTMTTINQQNLSSAPFPLPPFDEQVEIAEVLRNIDVSIYSHQARVDCLSDLFKAMLHELMTGNIPTTSLMEA